MYTYVYHITYNVYFNVYTHVYRIPYPYPSDGTLRSIFILAPEAKRRVASAERSSAAKRSGRGAASASARDQRAPAWLNKTQFK